MRIKPKWMVLARHFGMPGGLFDYGIADIKEFFNSFEDADKYAKELFDSTKRAVVYPMIWVLRCERTYRTEGIADSHIDKK